MKAVPLGELKMSTELITPELHFSKAAYDDLSREVYCVLGMPLDAVDMSAVMERIDRSADTGAPLFLSTPNLNYLVHSHTDTEFREALLLSDLCPSDGMAIVWLARLLGVPVRERVAGSDVFAALKGGRRPKRPLKVFLFGGDEGVAAAASEALNSIPGGVKCVGWHFPGFLSVEELSEDAIIDAINSVDVDFLVVCLGAKKGQLWLKRNLKRLRAPIRSHLGASLNFEAGKVQRAPVFMRKLGLEWMWRIKEEPYLWRRYWNDGSLLLRLLYSRVLPLWVYRVGMRGASGKAFSADCEKQAHGHKVTLTGPATAANIDEIIGVLRMAIAPDTRIAINMSAVSAIDARFLGALLVFSKMVRSINAEMTLIGVSPRLERVIRLNGAAFLLARREQGANLESLDRPDVSLARPLTYTQ
jgi:N-acetylglucosaminyldiphosphoundecaprenol N-acetyl-beta-D-mannosaminyltransferase